MTPEINAPNLDILLDRLRRGDRLERVLRDSPELDDSTRSYLASAALVQSLRSTDDAPAGAFERSQTKLLQNQRRSRPFFLKFPAVILRPRWSILAALGILVFSLLSTGAASAQSLPGDRLYPVKRAVEQTRLHLSASAQDRLQLESSFDDGRANEVESLLAEKRIEAVSFSGFLEYSTKMQTWRVGSIRVAFPPETPLPQAFQEDMNVEVAGVTQANGVVLIHEIQLHTIEISGVLQAVRPQGWLIDRVNISVPASTSITGPVRAGRWVHARIYRQVGIGLIASSIEIQPAPFMH